MRDLAVRVLERVIDHVQSLPDQPVHATAGGRKLAASLREPMPEDGAPLERLLRLLFGRVIPATFNTASPGYLAYIPGGGLFTSAVADFIALATNRYPGVWVAAPGLVQLEQNVLAWFAAELGLPETSGGLLTTGGSMANLIATVTARRERLPPDFLKGVVYTSDQAHHSVEKAAVIAGFPQERIRPVPSNERFRIDLAALTEAIAADRLAGLTPFMVVGSAGTTNTGAVDDLNALADIAERERLWFHVDAAYGGFFAFTERGKKKLVGISRADSITLDPHKGLFLPYGTGCLLVRDRSALRRAHSMKATYMPPMQTDDDLVDFCEMGPELSRESRGLRVWLPFKLHGARAFRDQLDEKLDLAHYAADAIREMPNIEMIAEPELSLLAFRYKPAGITSEAELEAMNKLLLGAVNDEQRVFLTAATVRGRFFIRICVLSFRTHRDRIDACLDDLRAGLRACERARRG
ncbi:MAG: aminotransferase class I/II-fold pyridoxal phosphate-dependent enzyme [Polyangiaceae bacterium]|nr:aminotransferase class I/II-fold pyridoxal phosphate-dependent enzyme [Polyangiaceae bacterium]